MLHVETVEINKILKKQFNFTCSPSLFAVLARYSQAKNFMIKNYIVKHTKTVLYIVISRQYTSNRLTYHTIYMQK